MKENNGRAARRMLLKRLSVVISCFVGIILLLNYLGIGGNAERKGFARPQKRDSRGTRGYDLSFHRFLFTLLVNLLTRTLILMFSCTLHSFHVVMDLKR
jgi:hypothetical protein